MNENRADGSGFRKVTGHENVVRHLRRAIRTDRVSHAFLLTGDAGSGKHTVAEAFAQALVCDTLRARIAEAGEGPAGTSPADEETDACGICPACRRALSGNHPDIIHVTHERAVFRVEEIREQVVDTAEIRPYEGGKKIYIIPDAECMNAAAQNALLKTMEDPRPFVVILLLAVSQESVLPTILSRCVRLPLLPLPDRTVREYLEKRMALPDYEARRIASFAQGNLGRAKSALTDPEVSERQSGVLALLVRAERLDTAEISAAVLRLKEDKEHVQEILDLMLMYYRDVMVLKSTGQANSLIFREEEKHIGENASKLSYGALRVIFRELDRARIRLAANVGFEITMEQLLLAVNREYKRERSLTGNIDISAMSGLPYDSP